MQIDWPRAQTRLSVTPDGDPGPKTCGALCRVVGDPPEGVALALAKWAVPYGMTTPARLAEFIAQIANETGGFRAWSENLNYSIAAIRKCWPARFPTDAHAHPCAHNPEALANKTYGGRMGNTEPGDGWRFRGRGALQLTGKANYAKFGKLIGIDLVGDPDLAADPFYSVQIALEFFRAGNVNAAVDRGDFRLARKITNGGDIGLDHVAALRGRLLAVLA